MSASQPTPGPQAPGNHRQPLRGSSTSSEASRAQVPTTHDEAAAEALRGAWHYLPTSPRLHFFPEGQPSLCGRWETPGPRATPKKDKTNCKDCAFYLARLTLNAEQGVPEIEGMQGFKCVWCKQPFYRKPQKGRRPKFCPLPRTCKKDNDVALEKKAAQKTVVQRLEEKLARSRARGVLVSPEVRKAQTQLQAHLIVARREEALEAEAAAKARGAEIEAELPPVRKCSQCGGVFESPDPKRKKCFGCQRPEYRRGECLICGATFTYIYSGKGVESCPRGLHIEGYNK